MSDVTEDFKHLLRELFQFDHADLDFGIYRILNQKRDQIEDFIQEDLVKEISSELERLEAVETQGVKEGFQEARERVVESFSEDALGRNDKLVEYQETPLGEEYIEVWEEWQEAQEQSASKDQVRRQIYDHLYRFFRRYYDDGDFVTKRRFSAGESKYAIPYDGEEVKLHWANRDQYYVKTSERFTDYRFNADDYYVHFKLVSADTPTDNTKGDTRYFIPFEGETTTIDEEDSTITIRFEYRPISDEEEDHYLEIYNDLPGKTYRTLSQGRLCEALESILMDKIEDPDVQSELARVDAQTEKSLLLTHLNRYTARNTSDYFIHKDLGGFLKGQLDYFIKSEVLHLEDVIGDAGEGALQQARVQADVVKTIGEKIIDFLAQIEDFQKRLFEKKKFVVDTEYCITLDRVPDTLYDEILDTEEQLDEWKDLYAVAEWPNGLFSQGYEDGAIKRDFLEAHPHVMIDTRYFDQPFVDKLLDHLSDLEDEGLSEVVDGLCIQGENFQALNLIRERFKEKVDCVYIDPPYNTGNDGFLYKDTYRHSSWMSMMADRVPPTADLLSEEGVFLLSCDDNEEHRLRNMMETVMPSVDFMSNLIWKSRQNVDSRSNDNISNDHEFVLAYGSSLRGAEKDLDKYSNPDEDPRGPWMSDNMVGLATRARRPNLHFHILVGEIGSMSTDNGSTSLVIDGRDYTLNQEKVVGENPEPGDLGFVCLTLDKETGLAAGGVPPPRDGREVHHSLYTCPDKGWRHDPISMAEKITDSRVLWPSSPEGRPRKKKFQFELESQFTGFSSYVGFTRDGTSELADLFRTEIEISFPKPTSLIETLVEQSAGSDGIIMDYFAGSGTTGHAVMAMNNDDEVEGDDRQYLLVELGDYFNTIMMPRLKKVALTNDWEEGVPENRNGQSHVIKYHRLESYEDTLNNLHVEEPEGPQKKLLYEEMDDYVLQYMLEHETDGSPSLLAEEAFTHPFDYTLQIKEDGESPEPTEVDLVETFHYLIGMTVQEYTTADHQGRRYVSTQGTVETSTGIDEVRCIWRDTEEPDALNLGEEATWAEEHLLAETPADRIYVNGTTQIPGAKPVEIPFRNRMG